MPYQRNLSRARAAIKATKQQRVKIIAQDALRKIRLGHECDVPHDLAARALDQIEEVLAA